MRVIIIDVARARMFVQVIPHTVEYTWQPPLAPYVASQQRSSVSNEVPASMRAAQAATPSA